MASDFSIGADDAHCSFTADYLNVTESFHLNQQVSAPTHTLDLVFTREAPIRATTLFVISTSTWSFADAESVQLFACQTSAEDGRDALLAAASSDSDF